MEAILQIISDASDVIRAGSERVVAIVRSLRSFARLDEAELKNVSIHEGIEDTVHHGRIEVESRVGEGTTVTTILSYGFTGFGPAMTRGRSSTAPLRARLPRPGAQIPIAVVVDAQTLFAQVVEQLDWINTECASAQWQGRIRNDPVTRR